MLDWKDVLIPHVGDARTQRLMTAKVGLIGAGGLGSNCALLLARCGIRDFVLADHDVVSVSNLNRQAYAPNQVGLCKVRALADVLRFWLNDSTPAPQITLHSRRVASEDMALFDGCDVVVEAVDDAVTKKELVQALLDAGHTVVSASGMAGWGHDMSRKRMGRLSVVGDFSRAVGPDAPPMAPRVVMAAAMQADEVIWRLLSV